MLLQSWKKGTWGICPTFTKINLNFINKRHWVDAGCAPPSLRCFFLFLLLLIRGLCFSLIFDCFQYATIEDWRLSWVSRGHWQQPYFPSIRPEFIHAVPSVDLNVSKHPVSLCFMFLWFQSLWYEVAIVYVRLMCRDDNFGFLFGDSWHAVA